MAKNTSFNWTVGGALPVLESHSNAKLLLLSEYLNRYFDTVVPNPRMDRISITLIDGFSGGGQYQRHGEEKMGSPFVILDAVRDATKRLNEGRFKPLVIDAKFYFIDSNKNAVSHLQHLIENSEYADDFRNERIVILNNGFEQICPSVIKEIKERQRGGRSVFVLDQKGWNAVQFGTIRSILSDLPKSEVILTFSVDWLVTYMTNTDSFAKAMQKIGITSKRLATYLSQRGDEGYKYIIPRLLLQDIRDLTGAAFFTPFFLRSQNAKRNLWIIHLSKLVTARNVMVESHWRVGNASLHKGNAGLNMLGFDPHWEEGVALDFEFDRTAGSKIEGAMLNEMPYALESLEREGPLSVAKFIHSIANDTAATREHIEGALRTLQVDKQIELLSSGGKLRKTGVKPDNSDYIRLSKQTYLFGVGF